MTDFNPANWNWAQLKAAGRHGLTYVAGAVSAAVALHILSPSQGSDITGSLNLLAHGIGEIATAVTGLAAVVVPLYTSWRAAKSASPSEQVKSVVSNLSAPQITQAANAVADPTSRTKLIEAVADMAEVEKIVPVDPALAMATASPKVTTS